MNIVRDFSHCPRCGTETLPCIAWNGGRSEHWRECALCNTYINTYIPQTHQRAVHTDNHTFIGNFGG